LWIFTWILESIHQSESHIHPPFFFSEFLLSFPLLQAALGVSEKSLVAELAFQVMPMQAGEILGGESSGKTTSDG